MLSGPYIASLLSQKLGYQVTANEPYYTPGLHVQRSAFFPDAIIPQCAWSSPA